MASLFEEYERAAMQSVQPPSTATRTEPVATGFINARLDDDTTPIFCKQRINFDPLDPITHMCVCNNHLVMGMTTNILLRIDLEHPEVPDETELPKSVDDSIQAMYFDPTGRHLIISMSSSENYYLVRGSKKVRTLGKLKGHKITSIGWNVHNVTDSSTGEILIGTSKGLILETSIASGEDSRLFTINVEQYVKQLFCLAKEKPYPVTGLEFEKMPSTSLTDYRYFVLATLPGRLYQFVGGISTSAEAPIFQSVFSAYEDIPERFLELPGNFGYSKLCLFHPRFRTPPTSFAWMTGIGVYHGKINVTGSAGHDAVILNARLVQYPRDEGEGRDNPLSMVQTEFHVLVLFPDRLKAICGLSEELVFCDLFRDINRFGQVRGMCRDPLKETIWVYTSKAVYKYKVTREARDVWKMYLERNEFALAKSFTADNPVNRDKVLTKEAEYLFSAGKFIESAEAYASTQTSFEEVALKFVTLEKKEALKHFLKIRLDNLRSQDKTQIAMLVAWLSEIWLNEIGRLKERGEEMSANYEALQESFRKFLNTPRVKECASENRSMIYDLIASHGDVEDMIFFAVLIQDYERVISHHIQQENYRSALEVLAKQGTRDQFSRELFYKFSPILMQNIPKETVDAWIAKKDQLDPKRLIPALVQYDHNKYVAQTNEALRYLEYCTQKLGIRDEAIHNYLLCLYAKFKPDQLMPYLYLQGQEADQVSYDLKYALRLCSECDHKRACIHIYTTMGLYDEAVDLALQVDIELAKQNAEKPEDNEELKKKLWLKIARHVVENERDIKKAMEFLHSCSLLKIEDILPFFPDFVTIDHFKDAICTSLQEYNQHIEQLKEEMDDATESAKEIRTEIQRLRNKFSFVRGQDKCSSCSYPLMIRAFYLFPCSHRFHTDCLIAEVLPHLTDSKRARASELQRKLASKERATRTSPQTQTIAMGILGIAGNDQNFKEELDDLVASECIYCGDIMIRCVDKPFIEEKDYEAVIQSWL
jgi:hypothetical protein